MLLGTVHNDRLRAWVGAYQGLGLFDDSSTDWRKSRFPIFPPLPRKEVSKLQLLSKNWSSVDPKTRVTRVLDEGTRLQYNFGSEVAGLLEC